MRIIILATVNSDLTGTKKGYVQGTYMTHNKKEQWLIETPVDVSFFREWWCIALSMNGSWIASYTTDRSSSKFHKIMAMWLVSPQKKKTYGWTVIPYCYLDYHYYQSIYCYHYCYCHYDVDYCYYILLLLWLELSKINLAPRIPLWESGDSHGIPWLMVFDPSVLASRLRSL